MPSDPKVIQRLSEKADEADQQAQKWFNGAKFFTAAWIGGIALNTASLIFNKKRLFRGFGGWNESISPVEGGIMGGLGVTSLIGSAKENRAVAFQESIAEIQNANVADPAGSSADWQAKLTTSESLPIKR